MHTIIIAVIQMRPVHASIHASIHAAFVNTPV